jgi:hypothetical protein
MGRWIVGSLLALGLLAGALFASSSSANTHDQTPALNDQFAADIAAPGR